MAASFRDNSWPQQQVTGAQFLEQRQALREMKVKNRRAEAGKKAGGLGEAQSCGRGGAGSGARVAACRAQPPRPEGLPA